MSQRESVLKDVEQAQAQAQAQARNQAPQTVSSLWSLIRVYY